MDILLLNEVSVLSSRSQIVGLQHIGPRLKSIAQCLISFPLTAPSPSVT